MKKVRIAAFAGAATLALAVPALAQTPPEPFTSVSGTVSPASGGSAKKPKNGEVGLTFTLNPQSKKTVSNIHYLLPKNIVLNGTGFKTCTAAKILAEGESACPKGSQVGSGTADVALGPVPSPIGAFDTKVFVAGPKKIAISLTGPVEGVPPFEAKIVKSGGTYGQRLDITVPSEAQKNAGLFVYLTGIETNIGGAKTTKKVTVKKGGKKKKVKKTFYFAGLTGCPTDGTHDAAVSIDFVANDAGGAGTAGPATTTVDCS